MNSNIFIMDDQVNEVLVAEDERISNDLSDLYLGIASAEDYDDEQKTDASVVLDSVIADEADKLNLAVIDPVGEFVYDYAGEDVFVASDKMQQAVDKLAERVGKIIEVCEKSGIEVLFAYTTMLKTNNLDGLKALSEATDGVLGKVEVGCFEN